ncbi:hypothetical protein Cs7R123_20150 [Catellatospora sp. TT07R-123]|uniref:glycosyltransferase family 39 protein n=1 Tax=Catellatospora sp. TT07R-123 TaxID=2733863 RepID=UPI001B211564|nr:glycosyltransferase family 39 protein [Catellatospora sp. TT07R-123]GHJ44673.1 hypothetical protein Cs7R123_20150 [Catellatospora sp. TT07R-123]
MSTSDAVTPAPPASDPGVLTAAPPGDRTGPAAAGPAAASRAARWRRRVPLLVLLLGTAVLYLWDLSASGWANSYYAAAVQAGTQDLKAMLFGSLDAGNFITVDKTPASLWLMALSARIFGFSSWSILVPQALCGVGAVALTYAAVRRWAGETGGLLAGAVLALTPVAALMFRFDNPDALLTLLLVLAAYAVTRALERASTWWLVAAGAAVGFGYLTKMLQALLVLPALGLVYLICAPTRFWRRVWQLLAAAGAMIVAAGWWVALVELWPKGSRPYVGGSTNNSILELTLGYNGLGRLTGNERGGLTGAVSGGTGGFPGGMPDGGMPGGGRGFGGFGGEAGLTRLFNDSMGGQASWLLPAALTLLVAGLVVTWRRPRTDAARAGLILWGAWLVTHVLVFSLMEGIVHEYYTVALAPALGALVGGGSVLLWHLRDPRPAPLADGSGVGAVAIAGGMIGVSGQNVATGAAEGPQTAISNAAPVSGGSAAGAGDGLRPWAAWVARAGLAAAVLVTGWWAFVLLGRVDWQPWLRSVVLVLCVVGAVALLVPWRAARASRFAFAGAVAAGVGMLAGPAAYTVQTVSTPHTGSIPLAGPASSGGFGGMRGFPGGFRPDGQNLPGQGFPGQNLPGQDGTGQGAQGQGAQGQQGQGGNRDGGGFGFPGGGMRPGGGMPGEAPADAELVKLIEGSDRTWAAAVSGAQSAAALELASGKSVMGMGGWSGDPAPTLAQFQQWAQQGRIGYFVGGGQGGFGGRGGSSQEIAAWVQQHYTALTVGTQTVYDLSKPLP